MNHQDIIKEGRDSSIMLGYVMAFILVSFVLLLVLFCVHQAGAAEIPEELAVRAVIGEASNQGYDGMLAVSCALRNRGTLKGVYGLKAKHVNKQPKWVWQLARKAWRASASGDCTNGARFWENTKAFGRPAWSKNMEIALVCKDHTFFREPKKGGVNFAYMRGHAAVLRETTSAFVSAVQTRNREQAQVFFERIQQILRDMPDSARNGELMNEYFLLVEQIRETGEATEAVRERLARITAEGGAHIVMQSTPKGRK